MTKRTLVYRDSCYDSEHYLFACANAGGSMTIHDPNAATDLIDCLALPEPPMPARLDDDDDAEFLLQHERRLRLEADMIGKRAEQILARRARRRAQIDRQFAEAVAPPCAGIGDVDG